MNQNGFVTKKMQKCHVFLQNASNFRGCDAKIKKLRHDAAEFHKSEPGVVGALPGNEGLLCAVSKNE